MAYNKDSGETKLQKNVDQNAYVRKKNRNIFKNSQTSTQTPPKPQRKTDYEWEIPDVENDNNIPNIEEFNFGQDRTDTSRYEQERRRYEKKEANDKRSLLSFKDIILIIVANAFLPIVGGIFYYIILAVKSERQKAAQSIVLSGIVSFIRILYLVNTN
jgi:hypothetical protein